MLGASDMLMEGFKSAAAGLMPSLSVRGGRLPHASCCAFLRRRDLKLPAPPMPSRRDRRGRPATAHGTRSAFPPNARIEARDPFVHLDAPARPVAPLQTRAPPTRTGF
jgi:hypothetical protein